MHFSISCSFRLSSVTVELTVQACVPPEAPQSPTHPEPDLRNGTNMTAMLRCFRGKVVLMITWSGVQR